MKKIDRALEKKCEAASERWADDQDIGEENGERDIATTAYAMGLYDGLKKTIGRPMKLDDKKVRAIKKTGASLAAIAEIFKVTRGAVQASLKRSK